MKSKKQRARQVEGRGQDGFQDKLLGMLEWLADKDPVRAARLIGDYLDDLADELDTKTRPAKGGAAG
jgi:hypothetical protein